MCGIAGIVGTDSAGKERSRELSVMLGQIRHRGPDDQGEWSCDWCRLGMVRLSIIDLEAGRQPMVSRDQRWVLIVNGEIYNFLELRKRLEGEGAVLRTRSDTEVLLEMIARFGVPHTIESIEGMFAFAAVDCERRQLWLARDRFGEKPLFLDRRGGGFRFCSELRPLWSGCASSNPIDVASLALLLRFGYPWPGTTPLAGVSELRPAHWLCRDASGPETTGRYWSPPDRVDEQPGRIEKCGERLLDLLDGSVKQRLIADVPLGLFLSGGIDSSAVAASAHRAEQKIQAVTVGFEDRRYDERPLARETAAHLGMRCLEESGEAVPFSPAAIDELVAHFGMPFHDTSAVPTRAVARAARHHFKVVLSGDGGDEMLGGYIGHLRDWRLRRLGLGRFGAAISSILAGIIPQEGSAEPWNRALALNAARPGGGLAAGLSGVFSDEMITALFKDTLHSPAVRAGLEQSAALARDFWGRTPDSTLAISRYYVETSMPQDILAKVDRMSMAESLEVRAPFLDSRLAAYAMSLPSAYKLRDGVGKYVLRNALRGKLPEKVLSAPKRGFDLPVRQWLGDTFWRLLEQETEEYSRSGGEMNAAALRQRVQTDAEECRRSDSYRPLHRGFLLYTFLRWRRMLESAATEPAGSLTGARP